MNNSGANLQSGMTHIHERPYTDRHLHTHTLTHRQTGSVCSVSGDVSSQIVWPLSGDSQPSQGLPILLPVSQEPGFDTAAHTVF